MWNPPKTKAEAQKYRYNQWVGNHKGHPYAQTRCAYEVTPNTRGGAAERHQCNRPLGFGPDGLYCKQHAKKAGV